MDAMKRALAFSAILLLTAATASAQTPRPRRFSNSLLNDVVEMTRASLPDETIIAYVKARRARLDGDVSAEDLIRLRQAGVSDSVVRSIAGLAGSGAAANGRDTGMTYDSREGGDDPVQPVDGYAYGYGYPYWYGYAYGYPYWYAYSPFFSTTFFVGGGRFFHDGHRSFGHDRFHHGGGRGHGSGGHGHGGSHGHGGGGHGGHGHR